MAHLQNVLDAIRCPVCVRETGITLKILQCGHTYCEECLNGPNMTCPECRRDTVLPDGGIGKLSTNFRLMSLQDQVASQEQEQNEGAEQASLPYDFCVLTEEENDVITSLAEDIVTRLEKEKIDDRKVNGHWEPRDATPGKPVLRNIGESIKGSKFILVLLHRSNIKAAWMEMKHNMALNAMLDNPERRDSVIPIYLCERENPVRKDEKPDELNVFDGLTYIINDENNNEEFWKKLGKTVIDKEINIDSGYSYIS